jgi:hypothetical protein
VITLPTYRGKPVFDWEPDADGPTGRIRLVQPKNRLATPAGPVHDDSPHRPSPNTGRRLRYVLQTRDELLDARSLVCDVLEGRRNCIWVPSWLEDLSLDEAIEEGSDEITIRGCGFTEYYLVEGAGREHIAIFVRVEGEGPQMLRRKVESVEMNEDGTETLTLDSAIDVDVPIGAMVSFLHYVRAAEDRLILEWETMGVGVIEIPVIDVPKEAP